MNSYKVLQSLCQRYLDAYDKDEINSPLCQKIKKLKDDPKITDPTEFIKKLKQNHWELSAKSILTKITEQKDAAIDARNQSKSLTQFKNFLVRFGLIFFGLSKAIARAKTGNWDSDRLLKDKSELFLEDFENIKETYHLTEQVPSAAQATATTSTQSITQTLAPTTQTNQSNSPETALPIQLFELHPGTEPTIIQHLKATVGPITTVDALKQYLANLSRLSRTSKFFHQSLAPYIRQLQANLLVLTIAYGDLDGAKKILDKRPDLLLIAAKKDVKDTNVDLDIHDYSGRDFDGFTPLQVAYASNGDDELFSLLVSYFEKIPKKKLPPNVTNALTLAAQQLDEMFPDWRARVEAFQQATESAAGASREASLSATAASSQEAIFDFNPILQDIINATPQEVDRAIKREGVEDRASQLWKDPLWQALETFRKAFTELSLCEKQFNPQHIIDAFKTYKTYQYNFGALHHWNRGDLFCIQVIGFVQRFASPWLAKGFAQGIYFIIDQHKLLQKDFKFKHEPDDPAHSFYPLGPSSSYSGLGFEYFAGAFLAGVRTRSEQREVLEASLVCVRDFVKQKHQNLMSTLATCDIQPRPLQHRMPDVSLKR